MGLQEVSGQFRSNSGSFPPFNINLYDPPATVNGEWTLGAAIIDPFPIQPPLGEVWEVTTWVIKFQGLSAPDNQTLPVYGVMGRMVGGLVTGTAQTTNGGTGVPWVNPMPGLPSSLVGVAELWNGQTDPQFPNAQALTPDSTPVNVPIIFAQDLSSPISLAAGDALSIGMWLTPSLTANMQLIICNASWTIYYDDGGNPVQGWGSG